MEIIQELHRAMEEIPQDQEKMLREDQEDLDLGMSLEVNPSASEQQPTSPRDEESPLQLYPQQNVSIPSYYTSATASDGSDLDGKVCRICHNGSSEESLLSPCKCCGSAKYAHQSCLMTWFERKNNKICELCLYEVKLVRKGFKYPNRWKLPRTSCDFVTFLFLFYCLVLVSFIGMALWVASNGCATTVCVLLYFVSFISLLYFSYCFGFIKQFVHYWSACLDINREVVILSRTEESKTRSLIVELGVTS